MSEAIWYIPGQDNQPAGPYRAEQISEWLKAGRVFATTLCWRKGMTEWAAISEVEPFAGELRQARAARRRRKTLIAAGVVATALIAVAAIVVIRMVMGPAEVRQARRLVAGGLYAEAIEVLQPYCRQNPLKYEANYLLAVATANEYAAPSRAEGGFGGAFGKSTPSLAEAKDLLARTLKARPSLIEQAGLDLAAATVRIPAEDPDALRRLISLVQLRAELDLADKGQLARELLSAAAASAQQDRRMLNEDIVIQITSWEPSLLEQAIDMVLAGEQSAPMGVLTSVATLRRWAQKQPQVAGALAGELLKRADSRGNAERYDQVENYLAAAKEIDVGTLPQIAVLRSRYLGRQLQDGDVAGFFRTLDRTCNESPEMRKLAVGLYMEAARLLADSDRARAQNALARALELDPKIAGTEEEALFCIGLMVPGEAKLQQCGLFLERHAGSPREAEVLLTIVRDAVAVLQRQGSWNRAKPEPHAMAAVAAAKELLQVHRNVRNLDNEVFKLAGALALTNGPDRAIDVTLALTAALANSPIRWTATQAAIEWCIAAGRSTAAFEPARTDSVEGLKRVLAELDSLRIVWIALNLKDVGAEDLERLGQWVTKGGVLWIESDLARSFGFKGVYEAAKDAGAGMGEVPRITHPMVSELAQQAVRYEIAAAGCFIAGRWDSVAGHMVPLLVGEKSRSDRAVVVCGARHEGRGAVVFRPAVIDNSSPTGRRLAANLLSFSLNPVQTPFELIPPPGQKPSRTAPQRRRSSR